jgi:FAD-dependent urate hydroxylase
VVVGAGARALPDRKAGILSPAGVDSNVVVVGAGPYGLTAAVQLRRAGVAVDVFGSPMSFWQAMPPGMLLRSNWSASSMIEREGPLSLGAFRAESGLQFEQPVPLDAFVAYGKWVQETAVPDLDRRAVAHVERHDGRFLVRLDDGEELTARRVVIACGIAPFAAKPDVFDALPAPLASHTSEVRELEAFAGRTVAVIGGGQSALETAALVVEAGASVEVIVRSSNVVWLRGHTVIKRLGRLGPIVYAPTDVGPLWYSRLVSQPPLFTLLPRESQDRIARRCIRPAGSHWLRTRLEPATLTLGRSVRHARAVDGRVELSLDDNTVRMVDRVLLGTGFSIDVTRYDMLADDVVAAVRREAGYPVLGRGLESTVEGLHFLGAPAARSFGPIMRFVSGSWFAGRALTARIAGASRSRATPKANA